VVRAEGGGGASGASLARVEGDQDRAEPPCFRDAERAQRAGQCLRHQAHHHGEAGPCGDFRQRMRWRALE